MIKQIFSIVFLLGATFANAQWNAHPGVNNLICSQPYDQQDPKIASDSKGGAIITWLDFRMDASMTAGDIYVQRIDRDGMVKWTLDGPVVCNETTDQTAPVITEDGVGGAIIVWVDKRGGTKDIYAQRVDSNGTMLWTANGVAACAKAGSQDNPRVLGDGANGALIVWEDDSTALGTPDLFMQHINASGSILWGGGGYRICAALGAQINPKMVTDGSGGAILTWQDKRNGSDYDIYTQRVNASGIPQWTNGGLALCQFAGTQSNPKIVSDFAGGAIISWQDKRSGIDYDVYAQYVVSGGTAQWTTGGKLICNASGAQSALDMAADAGMGGTIITWKDGRNVNFDIYAQKIDLGGTLQWAANGIAICNSANDQINPNTVPDGAGGAIVVWQDSLFGNWDIRSQRVSTSGTLVWPSAGVDVGIAALNQTSPKNISDGSGGSIFCFQDKRNTAFDIYAFRVDANGTPVSVNSVNVLNGLSVYPNPSNSGIRFAWNTHETFTLHVYDISGREILVKEKLQNEYYLNENLSAGIYSYRVETGKSNWNGKFIIENKL